MGLDTVEIILEIEEEFGINIPEGDGARIRTVGDLYRHVLCRRSLDGHGRCMGTYAFYRFRQALIEQRGLGRDAIRPDELMVDLLPTSDRRAAWSELSGRLGWGLPPLARPNWMGRGSRALVLASPLATFVFLLSFASFRGLLPFLPWDAFIPLCALVSLSTIAMSAIVLILAERLTRRYAVLLPESCQTIRCTIGEALRLNPGTIAQQMYEPRPDPAVWERVRSIICTQLGVAPDHVTEETSFDDFL